MHTKFSLEIVKGRDHSEDQVVDGRVIALGCELPKQTSQTIWDSDNTECQRSKCPDMQLDRWRLNLLSEFQTGFSGLVCFGMFACLRKCGVWNVDWINQAEDRRRLLTLVNAILNRRVAYPRLAERTVGFPGALHLAPH
jgi:hypothetical protein